MWRGGLMTVVTLENLVTGQNNLQNILDNMMEGIIAHDLDRRIFFSTARLKRSQGIRARM